MVPPRSRRLDLFGAKEAKLMFVRYGQAAMLAAIMTLAGSAAWAQQSCPLNAAGKADRCVASGCCKDGKCCKDGQCCSKGDECGCDKCGCKKATCGCCPIMHKLAKRIGIIMIMPASMPLPGACCMEAMGMLPHPTLPPPHVLLPPPLPPPVPFPHVAQVTEANNGNVIYGYNSNGGLCAGIAPAGPPTVYQCSIATPAAAIHIATTPSSDQLEMSVGEGTSVRCKKMTVTVGESEITVSRCVDRVRVRSEELYATAASVSTDGKDRLILDGDAVLRYKRDGHSAKVIGEHIELNLSNNAMTIQRTARISSSLQHPSKNVPPSPPSNLTPERVHG